MKKKSSSAKRFVVDIKAVQALGGDALAEDPDPNAGNKEQGEEYAPVLRTPNFFRKLYGYTVYHKDANSAF